jgi:hypothetical protein
MNVYPTQGMSRREAVNMVLYGVRQAQLDGLL